MAKIATDNRRIFIADAGHLHFSAKDTLMVLDLLKDPPPPNSKLLAAARALPKRRASSRT